MFSAFWEKAYSTLFEGASLLTPMNHPQMDMSVFPIIGRILSHGYLVAGVLPIRIALPTLTCMLLGPTAVITRDVLLDTFLDFISATERAIFKKALLLEAEKGLTYRHAGRINGHSCWIWMSCIAQAFHSNYCD